MTRLAGKVALVTGAAHGIGEGIARMFAAEGARVMLADLDQAAGEQVAADLRGQGQQAHFVSADVTSSDDIARMVEETVTCFGGLDTLVNNAAVTYFGRNLEAEDFEARYDLLMATNVKSVWMILRAAAGHLRVQGGSVINIASVQGMGGAAHNSAYAASKGALIAGTRALAVELAADLVRVNCISPGSILTRGPRNWLRQRLGEDIYQEFVTEFGDWQTENRKASQPLPLAGLPEDVAYCAVYLASDESRFCTGANFVIDGGMTALLPDPGARPKTIVQHQEKEIAVRAWIEDAKRRAENAD